MGEGPAPPGAAPEKIRWAPKVRPERIRRVYERDALGIVNDELIDDVGLALHARCRSIVLVNDGLVRCPRCATVYKVLRTYRERARGEPAPDPQLVAPCPAPACGWSTTAGAWWRSWRHRELHAGFGLPAIRDYADRYPGAATPGARLLLIDRLLHAFHTDLRRPGPGRPVAVNLLEGNRRQALALLDDLAYGDRSTPGLRATHADRREQARLGARPGAPGRPPGASRPAPPRPAPTPPDGDADPG